MKHAEKIIMDILSLPKYRHYDDNGVQIYESCDTGQWVKYSDIQEAVALFIKGENNENSQAHKIN